MGKSKYLRNVLAALRHADHDFSLIDDGDKILLGLSGGKDSLALLKALSIYGLFSKKHFIVKPVFLDLGFGGDGVKTLEDYCSSLGYELLVSDSRFVYDILKANTKPGKHIPCSICSRMKKAAMNNIAKDLGFNKVAFAHHSDDAIETLFMNMIHGGRVATFEPKMNLERAGITFIRPLIYCKESDLANLAEELSLPVMDSHCPANRNTDRENMKQILKDFGKKYPESQSNFRLMLTNYEPFCLHFASLEEECLKNHSIALKPIILGEDMRGTAFASKKKIEGEQLFLILKKHKRVGEIAWRNLSDHRVIIYSMVGEEKVLEIAVDSLIETISKEINPLTVVLERGHASLAKALSFTFGCEPGYKGKYHFLKIKK